MSFDIFSDEVFRLSKFFMFAFIIFYPFLIEVLPFYDFRICTDSWKLRNKRIQHTGGGLWANFLYIKKQFKIVHCENLQLNGYVQLPRKGTKMTRIASVSKIAPAAKLLSIFVKPGMKYNKA